MNQQQWRIKKGGDGAFLCLIPAISLFAFHRAITEMGGTADSLLLDEMNRQITSHAIIL